MPRQELGCLLIVWRESRCIGRAQTKGAHEGIAENQRNHQAALQPARDWEGPTIEV